MTNLWKKAMVHFLCTSLGGEDKGGQNSTGSQFYPSSYLSCVAIIGQLNK